MANNAEKQANTRLAIVDPEVCKPSQCNLECKRSCPPNKIGKACIMVTKESKISVISEILCIGCGACAKKCPFNAITIINLPTSLSTQISHRYFENGFKLHRLPIPKLGCVLGLVGTNGIGKSTALKILSGEIKPNLGIIKDAPDWMTIIAKYRGSELQHYFTKLLGNEIKSSTKIQYIDKVPSILRGEMKKNKDDIITVKEALEFKDERKMMNQYIDTFKLNQLLNRNICDLSGGELQRLACCITCLATADIYFFDEPSSYLDIKQRLFVAQAIRGLIGEKNYVLAIEHDLAILDLMCDYGSILYGQAGAYGVITAPYSIKQAINIFLEGFIPHENMRFGKEELIFNIAERPEKKDCSRMQYSNPELTKTYRKKNTDISEKLENLNIQETIFKLTVAPGSFDKSEIVVFLGENGMGKSTLVALIAGKLQSDNDVQFPPLSVSVKPQKILPKFKGTVRDLFMSKIRSSFLDPWFINEVLKPLNIDYLYNSTVDTLSGGELQRVAIIMCLGKEADLYLIDEPSAYLDSDQRIAISKIIKRFIYNTNRTAFIVEHDLIVGTYLADKIIVFKGIPGVESHASEPQSVENGMNEFLKMLNVTFRRDPENKRPRVNKLGSTKDLEQREKGKYFFA